MKKFLQLISCVLAAALVFGAGCFVGSHFGFEAEIVENQNSQQHFDLQLPGEVEKRVITAEEVASKLVECSHLTAYSGEYTVSKSGEYTRYWLDNFAIPGTTNRISMTCKGVVKVGCDIKTISPTVDNESYTIYIALPEFTVLDNYIIWDTVVYEETNNLLNPIEFSQYHAFISEMTEVGLSDVEAQGIYAAAEENFKSIIIGFLSSFEDYKVVFLTH